MPLARIGRGLLPVVHAVVAQHPGHAQPVVLERHFAPVRLRAAVRLQAGRDFAVDVKPEFTTNDMALMIRMAVAGSGITIGMEESFRPFIEQGQLIRVLEPYCPFFPGFFLYYPNRSNMAPKLRALLDYVSRNRKRLI
ncbi:MAG: hypothetical protein EOO21_05965 [Comamonadaceae bacterium]|nr:MAG: hypothetical protein EOO21_05965 [Comamonadaceae bacterium]